MKKVFPLLRRTAISLAVSMAVGLVALAIYTHTTEFREFLRRQMIASVNSSVHGELSIDRLEGSVWSVLTLHGVRLRYKGTDILEVSRLKIGCSLIPLLWGRVHIFTFEGFQPVLRLERDETGIWNINEALAPRTESDPNKPGFVVLLSSVVLRSASIDLALAGKERQIYRLRDADLNGRVEIRPVGIEVDVRQARSRIITDRLPEIRMDGSLAYQDTDLPATLQLKALQLESVDSRVNVTGKIADLETLKLDAIISLEKLTPSYLRRFVPQWSIHQDLRGTINVQGPPKALHGNLALAVGRGKVSGAFQVDLESESTGYNGDFKIADLDIGESLGTTDFNGVLSGRVKANGKGASLANAGGEADVAVRSAEIKGWRLGEIALAGNLRESVARVTGEVKGDVGSASLRGEILLQDKPRYNLALAVNDLNIQKVADGRPLEGQLHFKGTLQGTGLSLSEMNARASIQLLPSTIGGVKLEDGAAAAIIAERTIRVTQATVNAGDAHLAFNGELGTDPARKGSIRYQLRVGTLSPWLELVGEKGSGTVEISGQARGNLQRIDSQGKARFTSLRLRDIAIREGSLNFNLNNLIGPSRHHGALAGSFAGVQAGIQLQTLESSVQLSGDRPYLLHLDLKARDRHARAHALQADIDYRPEQISARVTQASLNLQDGTWRLVQPTTVTKRNDDFFIDRLSLQNRTRQVLLAGQFSLKGRQALTLNVAGLPLETLDAFLPRRPAMTGILSARAQLSGSAAAPEISGTLELADATVAGQPYAGLAGTIHYKDKMANVKATLRQDAAHSLAAAGTIPLILDWSGGWQARVAGPLDFQLRSSGLRVGILNAFTGDAVRELSGEIALDLTARGTISQPVFKGTFRLREAGMAVVPLGIRVSAVTADGALDGQTLKIAQFSARSNAGQLKGSGSMALKGRLPETFKVSLTANRWPAIATHRYQAVVDGKINLEGPFATPKISGSVEVLEANLRPDLSFLDHSETPIKRDNTIVVVRRETPGDGFRANADKKDDEDENGSYEKLRLDLNVSIPRNAWVKHRNANAELSGKLRILKQPQRKLALAGVIEIVRGWAGFQGKRFNLTQGRAVFTGAEDVNPSLDILAQYRLRDYVVEALVGGTVEKPQLTLRSQPSLDQADILALLLFGKPTNALNEKEQFSLQQSAIDITAGYAAGRIAAAVSRALGLERLGIDLADVDFSGGRVGFGHYVTRDAYVSISQELAGERGREFSVEYEVARNWKLRATTTPNGSNGVDIIWHKQY